MFNVKYMHSLNYTSIADQTFRKTLAESLTINYTISNQSSCLTVNCTAQFQLDRSETAYVLKPCKN